MKTWKKITLSMGTAACVVLPIGMVVSCGSITNNESHHTSDLEIHSAMAPENEQLDFKFSKGIVYENDPVEASLIKINSFIKQIENKNIFLASNNEIKKIAPEDILKFLKKWSFANQEDFNENSEEFLNIWNLGILDDKSKKLGSIIKIFFDEVNAPELKNLAKTYEAKAKTFVVNFYKGNFIFSEKHFIETGMEFDDRQKNIDYLNKIINGNWKILDVENYKKI